MFPPTVTYIAYHAVRQPEKAAAIVNDTAYDYRTFHRDIIAVAEALRRAGLKPGHTVAVEHQHVYLHWVAVLALEASGVTSFSYNVSDIRLLKEDLAKADLLLCTADGLPDTDHPHQLMDRAWISLIRQQAPEGIWEPTSLRAEAPLRLTRSSGTTGALKRMVHTARIREFWVSRFLFRAGVTDRSHYLLNLGFTIEAMLHYAVAMVRMGATCIFESRVNIASTLAEQAISHAALPTTAVRQILENLPADHRKPEDLTLFLISASAPADLRAKIKLHLTDEIIESYGTSEAGGICDMREDGLGRALPGVQVQVVDESDQPVLGTAGRIRLRSDGLISGYLDAPDATAEMFRNGWFYPGDLGIQEEPHTLRLIGCADDMFNIAGIKFLPGPIEARMKEALPVRDICLVQVADEAGLNSLCVVAVPAEGTNPEDLRLRLPPHLPAGLPPVELVFADQIPRTETGKVIRIELVRALRQRNMRAD